MLELGSASVHFSSMFHASRSFLDTRRKRRITHLCRSRGLEPGEFVVASLVWLRSMLMSIITTAVTSAGKLGMHPSCNRDIEADSCRY